MSIVLSKTTAYVGDTITISFDSNLHPWRSIHFSVGNTDFTDFFIDQYGRIQDEEVIFDRTAVIQFRLPENLYNAFNKRNNSVLARITYKTYTGPNLNTLRQIGNGTTVGFTIMAKESDCAPLLSCTVRDSNSQTLALTGDERVLVRYRSTAHCRLDITHKDVAPPHIYAVRATINGQYVINNEGMDTDFAFSGIRVFPMVAEDSFEFSARNSLEFNKTERLPVITSVSTVYAPNIKMIPYIELTLSPTVFRPSTGENKAYVKFTGSMFVGSFGAQSNHLTIQYRYREAGQIGWSERETISPDYIMLSGSSYQSIQPIELVGDFDYRKAYDVEFYAYDGSSDGTIKLTEVTMVQQVLIGIPVFDWGKNDFNINGDLCIYHQYIFDIIYPVGSIYMSTSSTLPRALGQLGRQGDTWLWSTRNSTIPGIYIWERVA